MRDQIETGSGRNRPMRYKQLCSTLLLSVILSSTAYSINMDGRIRSEVNSCHLREMELCIVGVASIIQNPNGLPVTEPEIKRHCDFLNESISCFDSYVDMCIGGNGLIRPMIDLFAGDIIRLGHEFCDVNSEFHKNYTKYAKCFREVQAKHQRECLTDLQVGFEGIHKVSLPNKMATACCNVNRMQDCVMSRVEEKCGPEAVEMITHLIERVASSAFSITCRAYDPFGDQCEKLLPKVGTKPYNGRNTSALSRVISTFASPSAQVRSRSGLYTNNDEDDARD